MEADLKEMVLLDFPVKGLYITITVNLTVVKLLRGLAFSSVSFIVICFLPTSDKSGVIDSVKAEPSKVIYEGSLD